MVSLSRKMIWIISISIIVVLTIFTITYVILINQPKGYVDHGPIVIQKDEDFDYYGFPGKGTERSPYLIQNFNITTNNTESIYIADTTKYFSIQNCYLKSDWTSISIHNVGNNTAKINDNVIVCDALFEGTVFVENANGLKLINNLIKNTMNSGGGPAGPWPRITLTIYKCEASVIKDNIFISLESSFSDSKNSIISNNEFSNLYWTSAFSTSSPNINIIDNIFHDKVNVYISSYNCSFSKNRFYDEGYITFNSPNSTISSNQIKYGGFSINHEYTDMSYYHSYSFQNNTVNGKSFGYFIDSEAITIAPTEYSQLFLVNCRNISINDFQIGKVSPGIALAHCTDIIVNNVNCSASTFNAIDLYNTNNSSIVGSYFSNNSYSVQIYYSKGITVLDNHFTYNDMALYVRTSEFINIINNTFLNCRYATFVSDSRIILVQSNSYSFISGPGSTGIYIRYCEISDIVDNDLVGGEEMSISGIEIEGGNNTTILKNQVTDFSRCIDLLGGSNHSVIGNNCSRGDRGIGDFSSNTAISNNTLSELTVSIRVYGGINHLVTSNIMSNFNTGIIVSAGVKFSTFQNNTCEFGLVGINVVDSSNCTFEFNTLNNNDYGFYFDHVESCLVNNNTCSYNINYGLYILNVSNCIFTYNLLEENNLYGMKLEDCQNNTLYFNAFIFNNQLVDSQAYDDTGLNTWYDILTSNGNYWSGWNSGLGPYSIDGTGIAEDLFPLDSNPL